MKPYYEHAGITIYHGDCLEILPKLSGDLVVTDPPYGIADTPITSVDTIDGRRGPRGGHVNTWHESSDWDRELDPSWIGAALSVGPVALFGHWRKRRKFEDAAGIEPRAEIIWAKDMHCGPPCPAAMQDERIWIFSRGSFKPCKFETTVWSVGVIPTWKFKHHKNEKPEALMVRLLSWMPEGVVIDPFMGSGTTLVAAKRLGRQAVGIEIKESYCEIAIKRLQQEALPLEMSS